MLTLALAAPAFTPLARVHAVAMMPARPAVMVAEEPTPAEVEAPANYNTASTFSTGPSDDPSVSCFMAPTWMEESDEKWVCTPTAELSKQDSTSAEDSY